MQRRSFVKAILALLTFGSERRAAAATRAGAFPITAQLSPVPGHPDWRTLPPQRRLDVLRETVDALVEHGFTGLECPLRLSWEETRAVLEHARSRGMHVSYDRTFDKGGVEMFGRNKPPDLSVFAPEYPDAVRRNIEAAFAEARPYAPLRDVFFFQDEPFHASPESFGSGGHVQQAFRKRYGYELPLDVQAARSDPKVWQDVIDFRSSEFPAGWRQAYRIIKALDPSANVILTYDSHSTFGAGVGSNATVAVDDVFHWGGDFADTFLFDIYPYMMFDFRYGDCGVMREPRFSQMHYALGQMRNLAYAHGKEFGFWFGTFNRKWFRRFMGPALRATSWAERETSLTAVAHGANLLVSGYNMPEDAGHWTSLGEGLRILQRAGRELLDAPRKKAKACFLFPRTQYVQLQEEYWNVGLSYELFLQAFGELDVLHEDQLTDSRLGGYPLLAMFDVRLLPDEISRRIDGFVRDGGTLVADCVPNLDRFGRPSHVLESLFGVRDAATGRVHRSGVWVPELDKPHWFVQPRQQDEGFAATTDRVSGTALTRAFDFTVASPRPSVVTGGEVLLKTASGHPALVRRIAGKGRAYLLGFCVQDSYFQTFKAGDERSRDQLRALLRVMTDDAGVHPHVSSSTPQIEAALRAGRGAGFLFAINHGARRASTRVRLTDVGFDVERILDLADQRAVGFVRDEGGLVIDVTVAPDQPKLLRLVRA